MRMDEILQQCQSIQNQANDTQLNLIIFGPTGSGKSTIANCLSNENDLIFQKQIESGCFLPLKANKFNISKDLTSSMTLVPQRFQINQKLTLWDIPGFGDNRSIEIDVQTTLLSSTLLNQCKKSLILLLIPQKQFIQDKAQKLVEILNMITNKNTNIILIISKAEQKLSTKYIKEFIIKLIEMQKQNQKLTRLTDCSAQLLEQIINKDRIRIFRQPQPSNVAGQYEFDKENINEVQQLILDEDLYSKVEFNLQFSTQSQQYMEDIQLKIKTKIEDQEINLQRLHSKLNLNQLKYQSDIIKKDQQQLKIHYDLNNQDYLENITKYNQISTILSSQLYNCTRFENNIKKIDNFIQLNDSYVKKQELYISSLTYSSIQLMKQMKEYQQQSVTAVHINSIISFFINGDIILPGVTIHITTQQFIVLQKSIINLKGKNGQPYQKAQIIDKLLPISQKGIQGQNGGSLQIKAKQYHNINLLTVNLSGGNGGDGQDGADGKDGLNGKDGDEGKVLRLEKDCYRGLDQRDSTLTQNITTFNTRFNQKYVSRGLNGEKGGDSSEGGIGGDEGIKGIFNINCQQDINIMYQDSQRGKRGKDGKVGKGGQRGRDYVGIYQLVKPLASFNKPEQPEKEEQIEQIQEDPNKEIDVSLIANAGLSVGCSISQQLAKQSAAKAAQKLTEEVSKAALKQVSEKVAQQVLKQTAQQLTGEVGKEVSKQAAQKLAKDIGGQMAKKAAQQILNRAGTQVANQVGQQITKQAAEKIGNQIGTAVAKQVGNQIIKKAGTQAAQKATRSNKRNWKRISKRTCYLGCNQWNKVRFLSKYLTYKAAKGFAVSMGYSMAITAFFQGIISAGDVYLNNGIWLEKGYQENQVISCSGTVINNSQQEGVNQIQNLFQQDHECDDDDQQERVKHYQQQQQLEKLFEKSIKDQEIFVLEENSKLNNHLIDDLNELILVQ